MITTITFNPQVMAARALSLHSCHHNAQGWGPLGKGRGSLLFSTEGHEYVALADILY